MPTRICWIALLVTSALTAAASACNGTTESSCRPGETLPCECADGTVGSRACVEDLLIWGACECDGAGGAAAGAGGGPLGGAGGAGGS